MTKKFSIYHFPFTIWKQQRGQTLLIIVLILVVSMTIGLSIVSKSITSVRTSVDEAKSAEALAAAEAGIAQVLQTGNNIAEEAELAGTTAKFKAEVNSVGGSAPFLLNNGLAVPQSTGTDLWLVPRLANGDPDYGSQWSSASPIYIYWGESTTQCNNAAIEVVLIKNYSSPTTDRYAIDPCSSRRTGGSANNFSAPDSGFTSVTIQGKTLRNRFSLPADTGLIAKIIPIYNSETVGVVHSGGGSIPTQGKIIIATGTSSDTQRKVTAFQGFSSVPVEFFSYGLFVPR